jgi:hypothetical protein
VDLFILLAPEHGVSNLLGVDAMRKVKFKCAADRIAMAIGETRAHVRVE